MFTSSRADHSMPLPSITEQETQLRIPKPIGQRNAKRKSITGLSPTLIPSLMSKPVLPSFSTIIDATSAASSPLPRPSSVGFRMDTQGNIKLPPLSSGEPQTPVVKNKLLYITPTTSMLRMGSASISSADTNSVTRRQAAMLPTPVIHSNTKHESNPSVTEPTPTASRPSSVGRSPSVNLSMTDNGPLHQTPSKRSKLTKRSNSTGTNLVLPDPESPTDSGLKISSSKKRTNKAKAFAFITHSQETFPSNEPSIDNAQLARRKRRRTSKNESDILKREFEVNPSPSKERRAELSIICNMSEKAVQVWFQNRRQNFRKKFRFDSKQIDSPLDDSNNIGLNSPEQLQQLRHQSASPTELPSNAETVEPEITFPHQQHNDAITTLNTGAQPSIKLESADAKIVSANDELKFQKKLKLDIPRYTTTSSPELVTSPSEKGKVLTFRLKQDNEMSRVYTSPNNRVNKLINGTSIKDFENASIKEVADEKTKLGENTNTTGKLNFSSNRGILKELNINAI